MNINYDKINEIYGQDMLFYINDNFEAVSNNIKYLTFLKFNDVQDIFERYVPIFLDDEEIFKNKLNNLVQKLGVNYVDKIENNLELLEELL